MCNIIVMVVLIYWRVFFIDMGLLVGVATLAGVNRGAVRFIVELIGAHVRGECLLCLYAEIVLFSTVNGHHSSPLICHECSKAEERSGNESKHDHHTKNCNACAEIAPAWAAVFEVVTAGLFVVVAFAFARGDVGGHTGPRGDPEEDRGAIEGGKGVHVGEAPSAGPHGDHDEVN